jgi:RHS repeat-associated protein
MHEQLPHMGVQEGAGLINMNGRMYDPLLGRMLSPDNYVQSPGFTQSYNRYSYCLNNPLKYTDPTGWEFGVYDYSQRYSKYYMNTAIMSSQSSSNGYNGPQGELYGGFRLGGSTDDALHYNWGSGAYEMNGEFVSTSYAMSRVHTTYFFTAEETYKRTDYLIPGSPGDMMGTGVYSIVRERYSSQLITAKNTGGGATAQSGGGWIEPANKWNGAVGVLAGAVETFSGNQTINNTIKLAHVGKALGYGTLALGTIIDGVGVFNH